MSLNPWINKSMVAAAVKPQNFSPENTIMLTTTSSSQSYTFLNGTGTGRQTFLFINDGNTYGVYLAWGVGSATATAFTAGVVKTQSFYLPPGAIMVLDLEDPTGTVDTIAVLQKTGASDIYISIGDGQ